MKWLGVGRAEFVIPMTTPCVALYQFQQRISAMTPTPGHLHQHQLWCTPQQKKGEALIKVPSKNGEVIKLYESLDAQNYLGVSAQTLNRWRREGWLIPTAEVGRGYAYTQEQLDDCIKVLGRDRKDKEVTYV